MMRSLSRGKISYKKEEVYFSVVIPMYNRAKLIRRCLDSCLSQNFEDYEIVVVDDGSEDDSVSVVESYLPNPHINLVKNAQNAGVCVARGLGVKHARGKWIIFMDSDDVFHAGAFQTMYEETQKAPQEVGEVRFCYYNEESGSVIPIPMMPKGILGFPEYLKWFGEVVKRADESHADLMHCQRREIYNFVRWPTDRQEYGLLYYNIALASKVKMIMSRKVVGTVYSDAPNRITERARNMAFEKGQIMARSYANSRARILRQYGKELKRYCPNVYESLYNNVGKLYMILGERLKGCRYLLKYITMRPFSLTGWGMLILGIIGPSAMNWGLRKFGKKARSVGKKLGVE